MKIRNIISICFSVLALSACDKLYDNDRIGQVIRFGASSGEDILTRTQYGETIDGGRQLIQWMDTDKVSIHMFWDGPDGEDGEFMDYGVKHYEDDGVISKARLQSLGSSLLWHGYFKDGKAHEYEHSFYSTYPNVGENGFVKNAQNEKKFHFSLPSTVEQPVDMRYAFMAAAKENVTSTEDVPVFLQYYPMVTTLYVTFQNDTESAIINEEVLLSGTVPIVGDYDIVYTGNLSQVSETGTSGGTELSAVVSIPTGGHTTVAFFIRPRAYTANSLTFTIHGKEHSLNTNLLPAYKYNITVYLSGKDLSFGDLDLGGAQLIGAVLLGGDYNLIEQIYKRLHPEDFPADDQYDTNRWHNAFTKWFQGTFIEFVNTDFKNMDKHFADLTDNEAEVIMEYLKTVTNIDLADRKLISGDIKPSVFDFFPAAKTLTIKGDNNANIDLSGTQFSEMTIKCFKNVNIEGCDSLTKVTASGSNRSMESFTLKSAPKCSEVYITEAEGLKKIDIENIKPDPDNLTPDEFTLSVNAVDSNLSSVILKNIPMFKSGSINGNNLRFSLTIEYCATDDRITGAKFTYPNNAQVTITSTEGSDKVAINE